AKNILVLNQPTQVQDVMAHTKPTAEKPTGGRAPRKNIALKSARKLAPKVVDDPDQRWEIWSVVDWKCDPGHYRYDVVWVLPGDRKRRGQMTSEPRAHLLSEVPSIESDLKVVDDWKTCIEVRPQNRTPITFEGFCKSVKIPISIAAAPDGRCGVFALESAALAIGAPLWSSSDLVTEFLSQNRPHPSDPANSSPVIVWASLLRYVKYANHRARKGGLPQLSQSVLQKNLVEGSVTGLRAIDYLPTRGLPLGWYVCAGLHPPPKQYAHCFMLEVEMPLPELPLAIVTLPPARLADDPPDTRVEPSEPLDEEEPPLPLREKNSSTNCLR
ncbi:hypothetical protein BBJ28_00022597, partial [Nothophytophthora sp. Chile5]